MKAVLVINYESDMKELVRILTENDCEVKVKKTGYYWEQKYQIEVSKDESNTSD